MGPKVNRNEAILLTDPEKKVWARTLAPKLKGKNVSHFFHARFFSADVTFQVQGNIEWEQEKGKVIAPQKMEAANNAQARAVQ